MYHRRAKHEYINAWYVMTCYSKRIVRNEVINGGLKEVAIRENVL